MRLIRYSFLLGLFSFIALIFLTHFQVGLAPYVPVEKIIWVFSWGFQIGASGFIFLLYFDWSICC